MHVIGTAGHVDHGKSSLVAALTGTHPDRLKEEQEREMTIDLGFADLKLPNGEQVGIVDVPGHRDFIENMLAGVGGIDAVLFVIAADEGVMPQTREHLAILDLLQANAGLIVLTKIDLVEQPEWLDLVEEDIRKTFGGTVLADAPICRVSAKTRVGLDGLIQSLQSILANRPQRPDLGRPRLPIDRVFSIAGFGTVVTGTLLDGRFHLGAEVEVLPTGRKGRIRGLQAHKQKEAAAEPGSRTAVNISGLEVDEIRRGDVLTLPGVYHSSRLLDVHLRLLADASTTLRHNSEVKFFLGASDVSARVRLLGAEALTPGQEGWLQLELHDPVVAVRGDRYILRWPSPAETLGGGTIINPHPKERYRRFDETALAQLNTLRQGSPSDLLLQAFQAQGAAPLRTVVENARMPAAQALEAIQALIEEGQLILLEPGAPDPSSDRMACSREQWARFTEQAVQALETYHRAHPLRRGMPREELKSRLRWSSTRLFQAALRSWIAEGIFEEGGPYLWKSGHQIQFSGQQKRAVDQLLNQFAQSPYAPPTIKEAQAAVGEEVYLALIDLEELVPVSADVVFGKEAYEQMTEQVKRYFLEEKTLSAAQFRDLFHTSRKYALAFLEHLDALGMTQRVGDFRVLRQAASHDAQNKAE
jgi:selenocysteine-specific elongation factor